MSFFNKDSLIPLTSLLAGIVLTSVFFAWRQQPSSEVQAAIARFNELPELQQTNVRNIAAEYVKDPAYQQRIQAIHIAVEKDPALLEKLHEVDRLLKSQDPPTRAKLQSKDANWLQQVEDLHRRQVTTGPMVKTERPFGPGSGEPIDLIAESQVGDFLDQIIGDSGSEELAGLDPETHRDERQLAKIIWLVKKLQPEGESDIYRGRVLEACKTFKVRPDDIEKLEEMKARLRPDEHQFLNRMMFFTIIRPLLKHYRDRFTQVHVPANSDAVEVFDDEVDRKRQLELMQMDPVEARSQLNSEIIRHLRVPDPAIESLNHDLKELDSQIPRWFDMSRGRGGFGGPGSSRSGFGFPNRPPQGGGRNGNNRDNRGSQRERPPGDKGGPPPRD